MACSTALAQTDSPVQATARPLGLCIADDVKLAGSDARSANFQSGVLPSVENLVNVKLSERQAINDSAMLLDPSKLSLATATDVRIYFVGEGAGYHNSLGFNVNHSGVLGGDPKLIFPDASSTDTYLDGGSSGSLRRTASEPLLPGDFVDLGMQSAGSKLDFFLIADGAHGGTNVYSTNQAVNPDHINHVVSFSTTKDSPYLIVGFEDLWGGGDRDFNDCIFAIDLGKTNVAQLRALTTAPEPALFLTLGSFLAVLMAVKRRTAGQADTV